MEYIVSSGDICSGIILENDSMTALDGGIAIGTTVNSRGILNVSSGGTADSTTVNYAGSMYVRPGGTAESAAVTGGGYFRVSSGGTATAIVEDGGYVYVANGATVSFVEHTFSGCVLSRTSATVHSGTTANSATVNEYGDFFGVAETWDGNGRNRGDNAFVLLDSGYSGEQIIYYWLENGLLDFTLSLTDSDAYRSNIYIMIEIRKADISRLLRPTSCCRISIFQTKTA